jgi:hypothetical protein
MFAYGMDASVFSGLSQADRISFPYTPYRRAPGRI